MRGDSRGEEYSYNLHFLHSFSFSLQLPPLTLSLPHFPSLSPILHSFILPSPFQFFFPALLLFPLPLPPAPPSPYFFPLFSTPLLLPTPLPLPLPLSPLPCPSPFPLCPAPCLC